MTLLLAWGSLTTAKWKSKGATLICFIVLCCVAHVTIAESEIANVTLYWDGGWPLCGECSAGSVEASFACSYGQRGNWSDGVKSFMDPTPPGSLISSVTAILYGTFVCDPLSNQENLWLQIGSNIFAKPQIMASLPCFCGNCVDTLVVTSDPLSSCDYPGYKHSQVNTFQIIVDGTNSLCLSRVVLFFNYTVAEPFYGQLSPPIGPTSGQTLVTVSGYTPPVGMEAFVTCVFNTSTVDATFIPPDTVQCLSPPSPSGSGSVDFYVTTVSTCTYVQPTTPNTSVFQYYTLPNVSSLAPNHGTTKGGTKVTITGTSFFNSAEINCRVGQSVANATYINNSTIVCLIPPGTGSEHVYLSFNGQQFFDTTFSFNYQEPKKFWTNSTTSWIILSVSGVAAIGLILLFIVLIRSRFRRDGYHQIIEGKQITIDEVRLGPRIGKGNFGEVHKAYWRGAEIAVKKLPAHNMTEQFLKDFHKEVSLMRALRHPNVIQFLGSCTVVPDICICTEYMPRGSLYKILHDPAQTLTWALIKKMCVDAAKGIVYLHDCTPVIVHRDLKSHNLLVDENYKVKVCDFGLSTIVEQASRTMTACGTPCWTAPEVLRNQRYTEKADVYSFGVVLWECATREDPFMGMPPFQVIFAVGREGLRPPLPRVCPAEFAKLITECWDERPNTRPSMKDVLARLEDLDTTGWPDISIHNPSPMSV